MDNMPSKKMDSRTDFLKIYANLPLGMRNEIILVLKDGPITWEVAYIEIINKTNTGEQILKNLKKFLII